VFGDDSRGSLDAWATLAGLAAVTERIRLGTLVSPATFRHPSVLAKMVVTVDHISGGRVELGLGAGWHVPEHEAYGFDYPEDDVRLEMLAEQVEIVHRSWSEAPFTFQGRHYRLRDVNALPRPIQEPHPPLIVGGRAGRLSAELAARWADEYNVVFRSSEECARRRDRVERAWGDAGREQPLRFSLMTGCVVGTDRDDLLARAKESMAAVREDGDPAAFLEHRAESWVVGTVDQAVERLRALEDAGVERVMLQQIVHDDVEKVELLGREVAPAVR
jgi:alkanesulfonate monooxygenase SsuD/methylene tetrahydromethanopterin reductase-like flavin-dependent oxidoreductase (luciferase family)